MDKLYIPKKLKVGYQKRTDTYTGSLAYIIYYDDKNVLRKEKSWSSWRDKNIADQEFVNEPLEGFVLNKNVGGYKSSWNYRSPHIRVYDPRGFEFEISVENLLFILSVNSCTKGKGLEGKYVYAWDKTDLVLLPTNVDEYEKSSEYTKLQAQPRLKIKDLHLGYTYITQNNAKWIYLGKLPIYNYVSYRKKSAGPHIFYHSSNNSYVFCPDAKQLVDIAIDSCSSIYADLVDDYQKSKYGSSIEELCLMPMQQKDENSYYFAARDGDKYLAFRNYGAGSIANIYYLEYEYRLINGKIERKHIYERKSQINTHQTLCARLKSGSIFRVSYGSLSDQYIEEIPNDNR